MDIKRNGRFTSSEIYKLMANGKAKDTIGTPFILIVKRFTLK